MRRALDRRQLLCGGCAVVAVGCGRKTDSPPGETTDTGSTEPTEPFDPNDPLANPDYPCNQPIEPDATGWVGYSLSLHPELASVGGWKGLTIPGSTPVKSILIAHVQQDCYVAVARNCTHQNTLIEYDPDRGQFVCPRHASLYDWEGVPVGGPAPVALEVFTAGSDGEKVWVYAANYME
jgi:Rieske Fe-S protein